MATEQTKPVAPNYDELAPRENPFELQRVAPGAAARYTDMLVPTDEILLTRGSVENLKIYSELLRDDQVRAAWQQRRLALTSCETMVEPGAEDAQSKAAAAALEEELAALVWDDVTDKQLYALFYGWSVAEILWKPNGSRVSFDRIIVRERSRFRFGRKGEVFLRDPAVGWVLMPERKFWVTTAGADHHDEPYGRGLAHSLYWPCFFKRQDTRFWLTFLEKFGMPTALAKLPAGQMEDPVKRQKALEMLRQIATDAGVVVPDDVEVELLEAARSAAADYEGMLDKMNAAISKIIVGQTATIEGTAGRLGSDDTQQDMLQAIVEADSDLLCGSFNDGPVKWWAEWNFPGAVPPKVYRKTEPAEDLNQRAERDERIYALGFEPDEAYIEDTYGVKGWKKKAQQQAPALAPGFGGGRQDPGDADPEQFAEAEMAALQALRAARRGDQQALVDAAKNFAEQYESIMGRKVGALVKAAETAEDYADFREKLDEILADGPAPEAVDKTTSGNFFARLLGVLRQQRRAA